MQEWAHDPAFFFLNLLYLIHFLYRMIIPRRLRWLWLTLGVVFLDRASKAWIESRPEDYFPHPIITNTVNLVYCTESWHRLQLFGGVLAICNPSSADCGRPDHHWFHRVVAGDQPQRGRAASGGARAAPWWRHRERHGPHSPRPRHRFPGSVVTNYSLAHFSSLAGVQRGRLGDHHWRSVDRA